MGQWIKCQNKAAVITVEVLSSFSEVKQWVRNFPWPLYGTYEEHRHRTGWQSCNGTLCPEVFPEEL